MANFTDKIQRNGFAPFRFLTPFPLRSSRRLRNSARQPFHFEPDVRVISISTRLILSCSNILGGRFHRLPSVEGSRRLNLQGRFFHSRVFYPHYLEENPVKKGGNKKRGCSFLYEKILQPLKGQESVEPEGAIRPWRWRGRISQNRGSTSSMF